MNSNRVTSRIGLVFVAMCFGLVLASCVHRVVRVETAPDHRTTLDRRSPFLKVHFKNGQLGIITDWIVDEASRNVQGSGTLLGVSRDTLATGPITIPIDSVALFETNVVKTSPSVAALAVMTGVSAALTVICISSPKTCFGSCPTFYWHNGTDTGLVAEGFSSSVAPSLEKTDIDALWNVRQRDGKVTLRLTNEALETHVVRKANLLAVEKPMGGRVLKDREENFYQISGVTEPVRCRDESGDCLELVRKFDRRERFSLADSTNLATKEMIDVVFAPRPADKLGLVIGSRQSLLSTYLFYQSLAYMGTRATEFLSKLEQGGRSARLAASGPGRLIGEISVWVRDAHDQWISVDSIMETGPLASDLFLVKLPAVGADTVRLRLQLNKGNWRIDYLALAEIGAPVEPIRLEPSLVTRNGEIDASATRQLSSDSSFLVTMPGDVYDITFSVPTGGTGDFELFLESRGYYLEWMRNEWLAEENTGRVAQMLLNPSEYLKGVANGYKKTEAEMEKFFWGSRYAH